MNGRRYYLFVSFSFIPSVTAFVRGQFAERMAIVGSGELHREKVASLSRVWHRVTNT